MAKFYRINTNQGFTIVELLVAIVVIAILAMIGFLSYNGIRQRAYDAKVDATLNQISKAVKSYTVKGNKIRQKYYAIQDFYANPGGGWASEGVTVHAGGGLGTELANRGFLSDNLQNGLKGGPKLDLGLKNRIKTINCGEDKLFVIIESYSGVKESELNTKLNNLQCAWKTEVAWRKENGLPAPSGWGTASGHYTVQPSYKYVEIDL